MKTQVTQASKALRAQTAVAIVTGIIAASASVQAAIELANKLPGNAVGSNFKLEQRKLLATLSSCSCGMQSLSETISKASEGVRSSIAASAYTDPALSESLISSFLGNKSYSKPALESILGVAASEGDTFYVVDALDHLDAKLTVFEKTITSLEDMVQKAKSVDDFQPAPFVSLHAAWAAFYLETVTAFAFITYVDQQEASATGTANNNQMAETTA